MNFRPVDAIRCQSAQYGRIALLEERYQQMLRTNVIVTVVPALLLRYAKHAACRQAKFREQSFEWLR